MVGSIWLNGITVALISSTQVKSRVVCAPCRGWRGQAGCAVSRYVCGGWRSSQAGVRPAPSERPGVVMELFHVLGIMVWMKYSGEMLMG